MNTSKVLSIQALDFTDIKAKFVQNGWSLAKVELIESWYKRFLTIKVKYPTEVIAPYGAIDDFWHAHILDTRRYAEDCEKIFGKFLHHAPSYGKRDLSDVMVKMTNLYLTEFGEDPATVFAKAEALCTLPTGNPECLDMQDVSKMKKGAECDDGSPFCSTPEEDRIRIVTEAECCQDEDHDMGVLPSMVIES